MTRGHGQRQLPERALYFHMSDIFCWSIQPLLLGPYYIIILRAAYRAKMLPSWATRLIDAVRERCHPRLIEVWGLAWGPYAGLLMHLNRLR